MLYHLPHPFLLRHSSGVLGLDFNFKLLVSTEKLNNTNAYVEERLALRRRGEREEVDVVQETRRRVLLAVGAGRRAADDEDVPALDRTRVAVARQGGLAREAVAVAISTPDWPMRLLQAEDGAIVVAHGSPIWCRRGARVFRGPGATEDVNTVPVRDGREPVAVRRRDALRLRRDPGSRPAVLVHFQARHERVRGNAAVRPVAPEDENGVPVAGRLRRGVACEIKILSRALTG